MPHLLVESPKVTGQSLAAKNGRILVRVIDEGQGNSGYFPADVLEQAARDRIFPKGTRMHLDHPGKASQEDLPERSVKDWVAVLSEDARYNPEDRSLEAEAAVFSAWRQVIEDLAPHVGMSIRAYATVADDGYTISRLTEGLSVDFVTQAGRGGKVLEILESARPAPVEEATSIDRRAQLSRALTDRYSREDGQYAWLRDFDESDQLCWYEMGSERLWQLSYTVDEDDLGVQLGSDPLEVRLVTRYIPLTTNTAEAEEGAHMPTITEAELSAFKEAQGNLETLTSESEQVRRERDAAIQERDAARAQLSEALKETAEALIAGSDLPEQAKDRVREAFQANPDLDVQAAITKEADYLKSVIPPAQVMGFGDTRPVGESAPLTSPWGRKIKEN